jgi:phosphatidylglycerol lysyltransferase
LAKESILRAVKVVLGFGVFGIALWALHHAMGFYHARDVLRELESMSDGRIVLGLVFTALSFLCLSCYDALAVRWAGKPLPFRKTSLVSFLGYAIGNNTGFANLGTSSIRYRFYSGWRLSGTEIAKVIAFCGFTFWIGFLTLGGALFLLDPFPMPERFHLSLGCVRVLGALFLSLLGIYLAVGLVRKRPIQIRGFEMKLPGLPVMLGQVISSSLDWAFAASVLYVLLPAELHFSYFQFLGVFLLAQILGILSHIPGGLGVFESIIVIFVSSGTVPASGVLGSILIYRVVYYLVPLSVALLVLLLYELRKRRAAIVGVSDTIARATSGLVPAALALTMFGAGAILLFSTVTPAAHGRIEILAQFIPRQGERSSHL